MGRAVGEPLCQQCKNFRKCDTKWRPGRARRHGGALRRAELVAGNRRPAIIRRRRPDQPHPPVARLGRQAPRCGGRVGPVRHGDGHVHGACAAIAVIGLDRHGVAGLGLEVERILGFDLPGSRVEGEGIRIRAFHGVDQGVVVRVRRRGDGRADIRVRRRVLRDVAHQRGVGECRGVVGTGIDDALDRDFHGGVAGIRAMSSPRLRL